jgi:hypothetical protein
MGQAFDSGDHFLGEVRGKDFDDVFDKLKSEFRQADKFVIGKGEPPTPTTEMPKYRSHKEVWALKIERIEYDNTKAQAEGRETDGSAMIVPSDPGYAPFKVDSAYLRKHDPHFGGYYVVYKDGYKSFSPAEAFESGYTRI